MRFRFRFHIHSALSIVFSIVFYSIRCSVKAKFKSLALRIFLFCCTSLATGTSLQRNPGLFQFSNYYSSKYLFVYIAANSFWKRQGKLAKLSCCLAKSDNTMLKIKLVKCSLIQSYWNAQVMVISRTIMWVWWSESSELGNTFPSQTSWWNGLIAIILCPLYRIIYDLHFLLAVKLVNSTRLFFYSKR